MGNKGFDGLSSLQTRDERGEFSVMVKKDNKVVEFVVDHHAFDVAGWDGYYCPWALNIADFEPRVGRFHLPPPVHQTFEGDLFVVCSFCPRPYDFDPEAVPVPYNHSNVMSDEAIYYASSEFMSRKGIEYGSITLHPDGIPYGPHPGRTEQSLGQAQTDELAVMPDSFRPLRVATPAAAVEDAGYQTSWFEGR
jgi:homogentisate 1,2-dioxygenase